MEPHQTHQDSPGSTIDTRGLPQDPRRKIWQPEAVWRSERLWNGDDNIAQMCWRAWEELVDQGLVDPIHRPQRAIWSMDYGIRVAFLLEAWWEVVPGKPADTWFVVHLDMHDGRTSVIRVEVQPR